MATRLQRPVTRVVDTRKHGELVVTMTTDGLVIREKGRRTAYACPSYGELYQRAVHAEVESRKRSKRTRR